MSLRIIYPGRYGNGLWFPTAYPTESDFWDGSSYTAERTLNTAAFGGRELIGQTPTKSFGEGAGLYVPITHKDFIRKVWAPRQVHVNLGGTVASAITFGDTDFDLNRVEGYTGTNIVEERTVYDRPYNYWYKPDSTDGFGIGSGWFGFGLSGNGYTGYGSLNIGWYVDKFAKHPTDPGFIYGVSVNGEMSHFSDYNTGRVEDAFRDYQFKIYKSYGWNNDPDAPVYNHSELTEAEAGNIVLNIDGQEFNIYSLGNITGTITVTTLEYWPYEDSTGTPVYDTSTGAELTDPLG